MRNKEYEVRYYNNVDAGTAEVKIAGLRQYVDCVSQAFVINKAGMAGAKVIATPVVYDGTPKIPKLSVSCNGRILELNKDYTLSCENNIESGTGFAVLTGKGNYEGAAETAFEIQKADIAKAGVSLEQRSYIYDGKAKTPSVAVKLGEKTLVLNTDYTVAYSNNTKAGTATVTVTGKSNYTGSKKVSFKIVGENPKITCKKTVYKVAYGTKPFKINATSKSKMAFTSSKPKIAAVDKNTGKVTIKNTGVATITIKAGNASKKVTIKVSPKKQAVKSAKAVKGKKLTVKWAKDKMASGYQVQISMDKNFKKNVKSKNLSKTSYTFIKLNTGKKYYVRVRSYKKSGKEMLYGAWSKVKLSSKVKK